MLRHNTIEKFKRVLIQHQPSTAYLPDAAHSVRGISMSVKSLVKPHPNPLREFGEGARILFLIWYICFH